MASIAEMVEAEAARAEAEESDEEEEEAEAAEAEGDDADEAEADEAEAEPQALAAIGETELKKAERAIAGQRKRLAGILGEGYVAHECLFCSGLGFYPSPPPAGTVFTIVEAEGGLAYEVQPPLADAPLREAPDKTACEWCDGVGFVTTGSRNPNARVAPCSKCQGNGWVQRAIEVPTPPLGPGATPPPAPTPAAIPEQLGVDAWGRPPGHQHWGVPPALIPG